MNDYELTKGFQQIQELIKKSNKLIDNLTPWKLWKENENLVLQQILSYLANGVKIIAFLLDCFLPETSTKICQSLNIKKNKSTWKKILDFSQLNDRKISADTNILFQRKNHL
jgi:methionyl-tRNA synthetase